MSTVRGRRQGHRRKDGRFQTQRTVDGRTKVFCSKKGESLRGLTDRADRWAYESREKGGRPEMRIDRAIDLYIEFRQGSGRAESTLKDDLFVSKLLKSALGPVKVGALDPIGIDLALRGWKEKPRTAKKIRDFGRKLYNWMIARGWAERNVFARSTPISYEPEYWEEPMSQEDFEKALPLVKSQNLRALYTLLRWTAIRPKSARELTWFEINRGAASYLRLSRAKSKAGRKPIFLRPEVLEAIDALPKTSQYVFPSTSKRRETWSETHVLSVWKRAMKEAGLDPRKVYDLKHLRVSELMDLTHGDADKVGRIIGVASLSVTRKNYRQFEQEALDEIALQKPG